MKATANRVTNMRLEINQSGRILLDWDDYSESNFEELAKEALKLGLLEPGYQYRFGYGQVFIVLHDNGTVSGHRYKDSWKGWDNLFEILPLRQVDN